MYRPGRRCKYKRTHLVRVRKYVFHAGRAPHRLRDEAHVGELQVVDQGGEIAGKVPRIRAARNFASRWVAAMSERHAGVATGEMRDLLPLGQMIAAESMGKDDRGA